MAITCSTVNSLFQRETNRFSVDVHQRYSVDGPWGRLIRVGKFPMGMGTSLSEITVERVLSGSFETDWTDVSTSNGTSSNGCVPSTTDLKFGQTSISWNLQTKAYQTPCICLDDLKTSFQIESQIAKTVEQLTQLTKTVLDNRRRFEYLRLVSKVGAGSNNEYTNIADVPPPTVKLAQDQLDVLRVRLIRDGAGHNALGKENGVPVLGLITSPETSRALLRDNTELRNDIRYATPSELIAPLGVERSFGGFYHMIDLEVPRFNYTVGNNNATFGNWIPVYPFQQTLTNSGNTSVWTINPAYNTATYEAAYIFHPDVYEEAVQQVGPNIPGASFDDYPYYYSGQFFWLNIRDAVVNPLGKIGRWLGIFQSGSRPIAPYLGRVIIHKRCVNDTTYVTCTANS